jgi:hypothetical protein
MLVLLVSLTDRRSETEPKETYNTVEEITYKKNTNCYHNLAKIYRINLYRYVKDLP